MQTRKLTDTGLATGPLILGGNVFGWTADEATSLQILDAFLDAGLNVIDTADVYSMWAPGHQGGESETIIGKWLARSGRRDEAVIITKVGVDMNVKGKPGEGSANLTREYILREVEDSLRRLQTDYIDLYLAHRDDENVPLEESLAAFDQLVRQGKVRAIGASNYGAARLEQALGVSAEKGLTRYQSLQPLYNLYERRDFEAGLRDVCLQRQISVIPYFGLGAGFLTGKYRSAEDLKGKPRGYRVGEMMNERGMRILDGLDTVAAETGSTPAQVALSWLHAQPGVTAPIASATSLAQLEELLGAARLQLDADMLALLDRASAY